MLSTIALVFLIVAFALLLIYSVKSFTENEPK